MNRLRSRVRGGGIASTGSSYLAETQAIIAAMSAMTPTREGLYDDFVQSGLTDGWWSLCDCIYICGAHDAAAGLINLKNPGTYNCTTSGTVTFLTDRHYVGNGTTGILNTNFNPATATTPNFVQNSGHLSFWGRNDIDIAAVDMGNGNSLIQVSNTSNQFNSRVNQASSLSITLAVNNASFYVINRTAADAIEGFRNASSVGTGSTASASPDSNPIYILGRSGTASFSTRQCFAATIGAGLSGAQITSLYNALNTFKTAVGA